MNTQKGPVPLDAVRLLAQVHLPELRRLQVDRLQPSVEMEKLPRVVVMLDGACISMPYVQPKAPKLVSLSKNGLLNEKTRVRHF